MRKVAKFLLLMFFCFCFPLMVKADSIDNIDMDIYIDKNGTAHITEVWSVYIDLQTEGSRPYYNLGNARITNFKVSENNKEYKKDIVYTDNGLELQWDISEYGYHNYKLTYNIEGFVLALSDTDAVCWQLISPDLLSNPKNVHIKIYSNNKYNSKLPISIYGKKDVTVRIHDGYIDINSKNKFNDDEYMAISIKFNKGTFNTYNKRDENFNHYFYVTNEAWIYIILKVITIFLKLFRFLPVIIFIIFTILIMIWSKKRSKSKTYVGHSTLSFGENGRVIPEDIPNTREIPFNNDIYMTYWIALSYGISNNETDFFSAILLKWMMEKKIRLTKTKIKIIFIVREEPAIDLTLMPTFDNNLERELYDMLKQANKNGMLVSRKFKRWARHHYSTIFRWFAAVAEEESEKLISMGKIQVEEKQMLKVIESNIYHIDPSIMNEAIKLKGFKNFLEEFSILDNNEKIEINMWTYYLIYAQILGISNKVAKKFIKLYPQITENSEYGYSYNDFMLINEISYSGINSAISAKRSSEMNR